MQHVLNRSDLQPFPGLYPTRWKIAAEYSWMPQTSRTRKTTQVFLYLGKPNRRVAAFVARLLSESTAGRLIAWEFDKGGSLARADVYLPYGSAVLPSHLTASHRFYFPFNSLGSFLTPWSRPVHRIPVVWQGRRCMIYSSTQVALLTPEIWQEHRAWLDTAHLTWGKPPSISTK